MLKMEITKVHDVIDAHVDQSVTAYVGVYPPGSLLLLLDLEVEVSNLCLNDCVRWDDQEWSILNPGGFSTIKGIMSHWMIIGRKS